MTQNSIIVCYTFLIVCFVLNKLRVYGNVNIYCMHKETDISNVDKESYNSKREEHCPVYIGLFGFGFQ